jgi:hypothetical protein
VHEDEGASEHGRVRADLYDTGHQISGVGQGVLQCTLSGRALTAIGIAEYPDDQPPREGWRHVRQLQRVYTCVEATCDPHWRPQVRRSGPLQPLP